MGLLKVLKDEIAFWRGLAVEHSWVYKYARVGSTMEQLRWCPDCDVMQMLDIDGWC